MPQPLWTRLAFAFLAAALLAVVLTAQRAPVAQGTWSVATELRGNATAEAQSWPLVVHLPSGMAGDGLTFAPRPATVTLRPLGPLNASAWFGVALVDRDGQVRLQAVLNPANPQNAPHGPPLAYLAAGDYELSVASGAANRTVAYAVEVTVFFPYAAAVEGWAVAPLALILLVVPAAAWAIFPLPAGLAERLRRMRRPPASP